MCTLLTNLLVNIQENLQSVIGEYGEMLGLDPQRETRIHLFIHLLLPSFIHSTKMRTVGLDKLGCTCKALWCLLPLLVPMCPSHEEVDSNIKKAHEGKEQSRRNPSVAGVNEKLSTDGAALCPCRHSRHCLEKKGEVSVVLQNERSQLQGQGHRTDDQEQTQVTHAQSILERILADGQGCDRNAGEERRNRTKRRDRN